MASKLLRRSGVAVGLIAELLEWKPTEIWQVGVGIYHEEIDVLQEEWGTPKTHIAGFEPNPVTFSRICEKYPGILFNLALSSFVGESKLCFDPKHVDGSTLKGLDHAKEDRVVQVSTLDVVGWHVAPGSLLWLDCEGSELDVLRGGLQFLKSVDVVNVEMTGRPFGTGWCKPLEVHRFLKSRGFRLQHIHTQRTTAGQFDAIYVRPRLFKVEYCCSFSEMEEEENSL